VTIEYSLTAVKHGRSLAAGSLSAKAELDGDDVFTPLLQQAVKALIPAVTRWERERFQ
jgi:hypothetical protein